jgi:hypothetical protein
MARPSLCVQQGGDNLLVREIAQLLPGFDNHIAVVEDFGNGIAVADGFAARAIHKQPFAAVVQMLPEKPLDLRSVDGGFHGFISLLGGRFVFLILTKV